MCSFHCSLPEKFHLGVYRKCWSQQQLKDNQRQQDLHCSLKKKERKKKLVTVTNRGYYRLSNFSGNTPEAVIDVRHRPTYTTGAEEIEADF